MNYVFYYKERKGVEHICYTSFNDDTQQESYGKIGNIDKLIEFIKRNCLSCSDVYFDGFENGRIIQVLNEVSDIIEINYPPIGMEGPYTMFKRYKKTRGK